MKNKPLKHYKRKKFFYRFFMRKSPRSGAMFGLSWMIFFGAILPISPWICTKFTVSRMAAVLPLGICFLIYAYGFLTFVKNFYTIMRNDLKKSRWWKIPSFFGAFSWELAGIFLLPVILQKRRWLALFPLLCSFVFVFAGFMLDTPLQKW